MIVLNIGALLVCLIAAFTFGYIAGKEKRNKE